MNSPPPIIDAAGGGGGGGVGQTQGLSSSLPVLRYAASTHLVPVTASSLVEKTGRNGVILGHLVSGLKV